MKSVFRASEEALAPDFIYDAVRMTMEAKSDKADSFLVHVHVGYRSRAGDLGEYSELPRYADALPGFAE
jgi:hypothetical protein